MTITLFKNFYYINIFNIIIYILIGYLLGSIPNGYIYAKNKGVNIFEVGSCNPGSTNIGRIFGKNAGRLIFLLDIIKTIMPIIICSFIYYYIYVNKNLSYGNSPYLLTMNELSMKISIFNDMTLNNLSDYNFFAGNLRYIKLIVGLGAIIGHNFSIYTKFKGGKGVTCTLAVIFCFNVYFAILLFVIFKICCKLTKYVSLSSILSLVVMFLFSLIFTIFNIYPFNVKYGKLIPFIIFFYMLLGIIRHKSNIKKLINGTENKIN